MNIILINYNVIN